MEKFNRLWSRLEALAAEDVEAIDAATLGRDIALLEVAAERLRAELRRRENNVRRRAVTGDTSGR
jgi:hypothetical protein